MAPLKSNSNTTHWTCCGFRRRTIVSKLTTLLCQVIVILVVWQLVRRHEYNIVCEDQNFERNSQESVPVCKPGEYIHGTSLQLWDIIKSSASPEAGEASGVSRHILQVEIFARDANTGSLVVYPKGTPFILGDVFSNEMNDVRPGTTTSTSTIATPIKGVDEKYFKELGKDSSDSQNRYNDNQIIPPGKRDGQEGNNVIKFTKEMVSGSSHAKEAIPGSMIMEQNQGNRASSKVDFLPGSKQSQSPSAGQREESNAYYTQLGLNRAAQTSSNQQQSLVSRGQNFDFEKFQTTPKDHATVEGTTMTATITPTPSEDYYDTGDMKLDDETQEPLYTTGFRGRIQMFKSEFYGRSLENHSGQSATTYLINNPNACASMETVDLLFLVHSLPQSEEQRQRIRTTFVKTDLFQPYNLVHVFLVGNTNSPNFQANLKSDAENYGDVIQGDFLDKPETNTLKGLMGMKWTQSHCSNAKYVLKIDEDVFVDTAKLLQSFIPTMAKVVGKRAMLCHFNQDATIPRTGPRAISRDIFPNSSRLRPYCKGYAVLMTQATVWSLTAASSHVPLCPLDDMHLYGVLPYIAGGIEVYDLGNKRAVHDFGMAVVTCYQELQDRCQYIITKAFSSRFTKLWELVQGLSANGSGRNFAGRSTWDVGSWRVQF